MPYTLRPMVLVLALTAGLFGCASIPSHTFECTTAGVDLAVVERGSIGMLGPSGCEPALTAIQRGTTVGGVQQRGRQTRTVGVPRGFLITLIVLLVLFSAG